MICISSSNFVIVYHKEENTSITSYESALLYQYKSTNDIWKTKFYKQEQQEPKYINYFNRKRR